MPHAIAPEVTSTISCPVRNSSAAWSHTCGRTSMRTSPRSSATMLEPSLTTAVLTRRRLRSVRIELEHHPADLHVVPRPEARRLERADHPKAAQPVLHIPERLVVVGVVARDQALDARAQHPECPIRSALDPELLLRAGPVDPVLRLGLAGGRGRLGRRDGLRRDALEDRP